MIVKKELLKRAMESNKELTEKIVYKMSVIQNLQDKVTGLEDFFPESTYSITDMKLLKKNVQLETLQVIGALAGEFKKQTGANLFTEYVNFKNYESLFGEERNKVVGQMTEILRVAKECCEELVIERGAYYYNTDIAS